EKRNAPVAGCHARAGIFRAAPAGAVGWSAATVVRTALAALERCDCQAGGQCQRERCDAASGFARVSVALAVSSEQPAARCGYAAALAVGCSAGPAFDHGSGCGVAGVSGNAECAASA